MRQLGTVRDERSARRFEDYLLTKGISVSVEPDPDGWKIWVRNEDHLEAARREFSEFSAAPDAAIYAEAARAAEQLREQERRRAQAARKNFVNVGQRWRPGSLGRCPVTSLLMAVSIAVAIFSDLGGKPSIVESLSIVPYEQVDANHIGYTPLRDLWYREPWRLVTPIFLHFGFLHILFNMLMLLQLGALVEGRRGWWRFALIVLLIAVPSNVAQYLWHGPTFGGMSGVVYGLFGYIWMKSRYEPASGFYISRDSVVWMVGWFFLCYFDIIPNVANVVHGVGLVVGMILGFLPRLLRGLR